MKHLSLLILAGLGVVVYGCQPAAKAPEGGKGELSVVGSTDDATAIKSKFDDPNAPPQSGGACGNDSQCTAMETLDCDYTANCYTTVGGGQKCMYYTSRKSANMHYYNTPCTAAVCGYSGSPPIQIPNIGLKLGTPHPVPGTYDRLNNCSDGGTCYNYYCGTTSGLHMYRY